MKRLLLLLGFFLSVLNLSAQVDPISGPTSVCIGSLSSYSYSDGTPSGTWSSSNTTVATINSSTGVIIPLSAGVTNIIYHVGPSTASLTVNVYTSPTAISGIDSFCDGTSTIFSEPLGSSGTWLSSNPAVVSVTATTGILIGNGAGTAFITYTESATGCQTVRGVTVNPNPGPITGITSISSIAGGDTTSLHDGGTGTWTSSDPAFATMGYYTGLLTGIASGLANVSFTYPTGCFATAIVSINELPDTLEIAHHIAIGDLVAWYPFCDDSNDHSGGGYNLDGYATVAGHSFPADRANLTTDRFGNPSSAWEFNGAKSEMSYNTYLPTVTPTGYITYSCWIYAYNQTTVNFPYSGSMRTYTVPANVHHLQITAAGASGGNELNDGAQGGTGVTENGYFTVVPGQVLDIIVAGKGVDGTYEGGGGGGSFVWDNATSALMIAGGGGGGASRNDSTRTGTPGINASTSAFGANGGSFPNGGGVGGNGATAPTGATIFDYAGGGAGWSSNGNSGYNPYQCGGATSGFTPLTGGGGGTFGGSSVAIVGSGGFGGGGGAQGLCDKGGGGGGGGYSGGGAGGELSASMGIYTPGGGGGSYNNGVSQSNTVGNFGNGSVILAGAGMPTTSFAYTGTIAAFTVPAGVDSINVTALGASGGSELADLAGGGHGAVIVGKFGVTGGQILNVLVGGEGFNAQYEGGGGGGSFVWDNATSVLMVAAAGGGGAGRNDVTSTGIAGLDASATVNGVNGGSMPNGGGTAGSGGIIPTGGVFAYAAGGAGWNTDGNAGINPLTCTSTATGGIDPLGGGNGGLAGGTVGDVGNGGFGGGGGAEGRCSKQGGGGGGGYSGGGGGGELTTTEGRYSAGGGGGSYNLGANAGSTVGNVGNGYVTIAPADQNSVIVYNGNLGGTQADCDGFGLVMNDGSLWNAASGATYTSTPGLDVSVMIGGIGQYMPVQIATNRWYNLLFTIIGGSGVFYINDTIQGIFTFPGPFRSVIPGEIFTVGNDSDLTRGFNGKIDDIAVYNRQLSPSELQEIYEFNPDVSPFTLGNDTVICSDSITIKPNPQTLGSIYIWGEVAAYTGIISTIDSSVADTSLTVSPPPTLFSGTGYWLTILKPFGCLETDTMTVLKSPIPINLGSDTSICAGDTVTLRAHGDSSASVRFLWSTGSTGDSIAATVTGQYYVEVDSEFFYTNTSGFLDSAKCVGRDTVTINARKVPMINFGDSSVSDCQGQMYTIRNVDSTYDVGDAYTWSVGTTDDTLLVTTSGRFWVSVNDTGCIRGDTINVVIVWDTMRLFTPDTAICLGNFVIPDVTINSLTGMSYQWTPTAGIPVSFVSEPTITPDTSSWYVLRSSYPGCPDILDSFFIDVQPTPVVYAGGNRQVCFWDTVHITAGVSPSWYPSYTFTWTPTAYIDNPFAQTVVFKAGDSTKLYVTVSTPAGCWGMDSSLVIVHPGDFDSALADIYLCPGDSVQLTPILNAGAIANGTVASYQWTPGLYLSDSNANQPWVHPITSISYRQIGVSQYGCEDTNTVSVTVYPAAVLYMPDSVIIQSGKTYQITPTTNCAYFAWTPATGISDTTSSDPYANPDYSTNYHVLATTNNGCTVYDSIEVTIANATLFSIPNAFTPGGSVNNILYVLPAGDIVLSYLRIYNRWGVQLFQSTNLSDGWDGTYQGKPQPQGVYIYQVEVVNAAGDAVDKAGNITLLR